MPFAGLGVENADPTFRWTYERNEPSLQGLYPRFVGGVFYA
jgi:hypothetical protein